MSLRHFGSGWSSGMSSKKVLISVKVLDDASSAGRKSLKTPFVSFAAAAGDVQFENVTSLQQRRRAQHAPKNF